MREGRSRGASEGGTERGAGAQTQTVRREWRDKVLLYGTGAYTQYPGITHNGKEQGKTCTYEQLTHLAVQQKLTQYCKSTIFQKNNV